MFTNIIKFFIENPKFNYVLFVLIFLTGIYSYNEMPKELFPNTSLDKIVINGNYSGSSIDNLNKMIVSDIEEDLSSMEDIKEIETTITNGKFTIVNTLKENIEKRDVLDDIETSIKKLKKNLPIDMNDPIATIIDIKKPLIYIGISSKTKSKKEILNMASKIKKEFYKIKGVGDIEIYGDVDSLIEFTLKDKKISSYGLNIEDVENSLINLSYTFPIGIIKDNKDGHFFVSMNNGNKTIKEFENTLLKIKNKSIYLNEIVEVNHTFEEDSIISSVNDIKTVILNISQQDNTDAILISNKIIELKNKLNSKYSNYKLIEYNDQSLQIKNRLNTVMTNIFVGMILVFISLAVLINFRSAIIIGLGIPTSFIIAFAFAYYLGYSINLVSLLGLLIALGIVVDDAIVVGENIQRHMELGEDKKTSVINGTVEMIEPVTMASLTTLFAFLPMFMISGEMGKFIILIPIMVVLLIISSLIEVFIFLPIHAEHTLSVDKKALDWSFLNKIYRKLLHFTIHFKKIFLSLFFIIVPLITILIIKSSSFQLFPSFDSDTFIISGKIGVNNTLKSTEKKIESLNKYLLENKNKYSIKSFTTIIGTRTLVSKGNEIGENMFQITIEFDPMYPENFIEEYINPYFAIEKVKEGNRKLKSGEIANIFRKDIPNLEVFNYIKSFDIIETKAGPVKSDIHISLISNDKDLLISHISDITDKLHSIKGVVGISDDSGLGVPELKLKINKYGESLGVTEKYLGKFLSNIYLENKKFNIFTSKELIEVNFNSIEEDILNDLKFKTIITINNKNVLLSDIVTFNIEKSFIQVIKEEGEMSKNIYANIGSNSITANEVLEKLSPIFEKIKKDNIKIIIKGEKEKNKEFASDMKVAAFVAFMLIILSMLYMFNSFGSVFIIVSVIPFSVMGAMMGHLIMGMNLSMPSMIGILGLAGVVINDSIIMLSFIDKSKDSKDFFERAIMRFRPIVLTSVTTLIGLSTLIFFATGQSLILQPIAVSLGFGLAWGTIVNLFYVPALYAVMNGFKDEKE